MVPQGTDHPPGRSFLGESRAAPHLLPVREADALDRRVVGRHAWLSPDIAGLRGRLTTAKWPGPSCEFVLFPPSPGYAVGVKTRHELRKG